MHTILICDDEPDIASALRIYLTAEGYEVLTAKDGQEALAIMESRQVHLVLMDVMMPKLDGISATARLRERSNVPIILLTAKSEDTDKVLGLTVGADDYVTKPFNPVELLARVRSQLRRYTLLGAMEAASAGERLVIGGVELDDERKQVWVDGEPVSLTPTEYSILKLMMAHPDKVFSSREIYRTVWNGAPLAAENTVAVHIRHLREKLEIDPAEPRYLQVVWGQGYKFNAGNRDSRG